MTKTELPPLPLLPFAVFDEFGKGADDRVQDYGRECARTVLAPLEAELERVRMDAARLDWMSTHEARIGWNREGEACRVWVQADEEDDHPTPVCGWERFFNSHREAIDAAMNTKGESA
jgi:hypothetical protein